MSDNTQTNEGVEVTKVPNEPVVVPMELDDEGQPTGGFADLLRGIMGDDTEMSDEEKRQADPEWGLAMDEYNGLDDEEKAWFVMRQQIAHLNEAVGHIGFIPLLSMQEWITDHENKEDMQQTCVHGHTVFQQWQALVEGALTLVRVMTDDVFHGGHGAAGDDIPAAPNALDGTIDLVSLLQPPQFNPFAGLFGGGNPFRGVEDTDLPDDEDGDEEAPVAP